MKEIVLAGGCFWGVENFMSKIDGVLETEVGYANGKIENPTYDNVCTGTTEFVEVCKVKYDPRVIKLKELLIEFWGIIDPTSLNKQGNDIGSQYRTGIYYLTEADIDIIIASKNNEQVLHAKEIVTEIKPLINYFKAEEYHQKYLEKHPSGYCHI